MDDALGDALDRCGLRCHRDAHRVIEHRVGKLGDFLRHGRREEQSLPFLAQHRHDALDVVDEAHVEHAVGFVEDEHFDLIERYCALVDEIEQTARRRDQNFNAMRERAHLTVDRHAANGERDRQRLDVAAIGAEAVRDLAGQFAGWRQHQHAAGLLLRPHTLGGEVMEDWQREGRGLAGAGLRNADDIAAREGCRNGLGLDRRGGFVFLFG